MKLRELAGDQAQSLHLQFVCLVDDFETLKSRSFATINYIPELGRSDDGRRVLVCTLGQDLDRPEIGNVGGSRLAIGDIAMLEDGRI